MAARVVSRPVEQRAVADFLAAAMFEPAALVLEGEAGIGKTTVWLDGIERARDAGFQVLSTRVSAAESVLAYAGLAALLDAVRPQAFATLPPPQRNAIDRVLLRTNADGPMTAQRAIGAALLSVLDALTVTGPVLLAIDDVQWLDQPSVQLISSTARRLRGRVGLMVAVRGGPDGAALRSWLELPRPDRLQWVSLRPLSVGALHSVVSERAGRSFSRPKMLQVHAVSGGNPFYAVELARAVGDGVWDAGVSLPGSLAELVRARIGSLPAGAHAALLAAACLADPTVEILARATETTADDVVAVLERVEDKGIVGIDGHRVTFTHPLLARGIYGESSPADRRRMHRRLADLLDEPELQARHLALAAVSGDPLTLQSLDSAADIARKRGAPAAAAELLELAIGLGGDTPERRLLAAANHFEAGDVAMARTQLRIVIDGLGPGAMRAEAIKLLAIVRLYDDGFIEAAELFERAIGESGENAPSRVQMQVMLSYALFDADRTEAAMHHVGQAVTNAEELGRPDMISQALGMRTTLRFLVGEGFDELSMARAVDLDDQADARPLAARSRVQHALLCAWSGRYDEADHEFAAIRKLCAERGEESELIFLDFHTALLKVWTGGFTTAHLVAEEVMERGLQLGGDLPMFIALTLRAMNGAYAGRVDDARRDTADALCAGERCGSQQLSVWPIVTLGFLETSLGHYEEALETLQPLLWRLAETPGYTEIISGSFIPDAVEAMIALDRLDDAEKIIGVLEANSRRLNRSWMTAIGARSRAMVLSARGDLDAAAAAAGRALDEQRHLGMPFELARTELVLGHIERRRRRRDVAAATLRTALRAFEDLGTPLWAERARRELSRAEPNPQRTPGLTVSEQRVAELAATGATNKDMAAALFISPKTVEANLTRIYRKLDIHSRAELGGLMGRTQE